MNTTRNDRAYLAYLEGLSPKEVIATRCLAEVRDEFGLCPVCSNDPEILNVGRNHFAICRKHKVYWYVGSNLFSGWQDESPTTWEANEKLLSTYTKESEADNDVMQSALGGTKAHQITIIDPQHWGELWANPAPFEIETSVSTMHGLPNAPVIVHLCQGVTPERAASLLREVADSLIRNGNMWLSDLDLIERIEQANMAESELPF